jgi:high-affinity nickel-transport protein
MLTAVLLGFVLGVRHAFDPDHVIAIGTLLARQGSRLTAAWIGVSWGIGHGATVLAVGFLVIALQVAIPDALVRGMELCIGVLLVVLGAANLFAATPDAPARLPTHGAPLRTSLARSGAIGLAHGLAGSAPVALLALAAMPSPEAALVYLVVFGAGTVLGMAAFSLVLGVPFSRPGAAAPLRRWITAGTGVVSLLFGAWLIWEIGVVAAQRAAL